jgi:sulfur carrier protein ThiS
MKYNKYIGLPYAANGRDESGIDCWGLVRLFYKQEYSIELPSYTEEYAGAYDTRILGMMDLYKNNWAQVAQPEVGSVIVFNILGEPFHVGIYIGDDKFIHARDGMDSVVESVNSPRWAKRIEGYYKYATQPQVQLVGKPHPFKQTSYLELAIPGSTLADVSQNLITTYKISDRFAKNLILFLNGEKVPQSEWNTTRVQAGQEIVYKVVPEGKTVTRLILTLVVIYVATQFGPGVGEFLGMTETVAGVETVTTAGKIVGTMAINMAGMALINAAFPIRPLTGKDPGSTAPVNAFNGASNQANRYGAIPVVLGKMRSTAMLGAVPYIETLTDTSVLNLSLVWGFGPLQVDDIRVGAKTLKEIYFTNQASTAQEHPVPVTLNGYPQENIAAFDALYPSDVEQQFPQIELVNNATDGNPPAIITLENYAEDIDVAFTFPEGMRKISAKDGSISEATCGIEVRLRKVGETTWGTVPLYRLGNYSDSSLNQSAFSTVLVGAPVITDSNGDAVSLYKFYTLAMSPGGGIVVFDGSATDSISSDPSNYLKTLYTQQSYAAFVSSSGTYSRLPQIPNGYRKLYTLCFYGDSYLPDQTVSHISSSQVVGLDLTSVTRNPQTDAAGNIVYDSDNNQLPTNSWTVNIEAGRFIETSPLVAGQPQTIFNATQFSGVISAGAYGDVWSDLLNQYSVWNSAGGVTFDKTAPSIVFPYTGYYEIQASSDNSGAVFIDGAKLITIPDNGYGSVAKNWYYAEAGSTHSIRMTVTNTGGPGGAALVISYTANAGLNIAGTAGTEIVFGQGGLFSMRKDAFNFVYKIKGLPRDRYQLRIIRTNNDVTEKDEDKDNRYYSKAILYGVVGYNKQELDGSGNLKPIRVVKNPTNSYLARTFIRLQSTNKINGSLEGVNALVQTIAPVLNRTNNKWNLVEPTNNPAALFLYVLMHPANAYRVADNITDAANYVDLNTLAEWYKFCHPMTYANNKYTKDSTKPWLSYNAILTSVASVMDVLKDICSAGKASPNYIDGKWTVVIDKPRSGVVQHFTPHNSWGFESTKILPRIPDAFRITIADEEKGYQANEYRVYNIGKNEANAELFEEISLPGVTNFAQAKHIAQWHMAQLKLRPEMYSLNVDFEYLVCNRGDVVRVTHDVPLWGAGSGRIKACQVSSINISLTEDIYLEAGKSYNIRVRTNTGASVLKSLTTISTTGYYDIISLTSPITLVDNINPDDLFMLGEVSKESQELVVLSIETSSNVSAKLTLADYSPQIYTADLSGYLGYNSNITSVANYLVNSIINEAPTIVSVNSDSAISEQITNGTYTNNAIVSYTNAPGLSKSAERLQLQVVPGDVMFDTGSPSYYALKDSSSISVQQLISGIIYKARARYTNSEATIVGPWSETFWFTNGGKTVNGSVAPLLTLDLDRTFVVAKPNTTLQTPDFLTYEYRLYKDTGTEDFWELTPNTTNNIKVIKSTGDARFDLREQPRPRLSADGVTYRVACRALDKQGNYSTTSTLGTIVIKTIT